MRNLPFTLLFVAILSFPHAVFGANWYVNKAATCAGTTASPCNGANWNSAWKELNQIAWSSVAAGDTIWIAGGSYTTGLNVGKNGTAQSPILITRVSSDPARSRPTIDDVAKSAAGWSAAYDSRVVVASGGPLKIAASYIQIDGRIDMGMRFSVSNSGGLPTSCDITGANTVTLSYLDLTGPNAAGFDDGSSCGSSLQSFNGDSSGVMIGYGYVPNPGSDNVTISRCRIRGHANEFWFAGARNITVENSKIYDNGAANSATWHGNMMIVNGSDGIVFRNNEVFNWQVEGLYPWGSVSKNWYVYGNLFHDGIGGKSGSTHRFLELRSYSGSVTHGPFYIYNNTVVTAWAGIMRGDTTVFWSSGSEAKNNIFWNINNPGIGYAPPIVSNNFSDGSAGSGAGSISNGSQPFANFAGKNYNLTATIGAAYPRNKGVAIPNVGQHRFDIDMNGNIRGADGSWDMGALEFPAAATTAPNPPSNLRLN